MKSGTDTAPVSGGPDNVVTLNTPPVRPANDPVWLAPPDALNVGPKIICVGVTVTVLPLMLAPPVMDVAPAGDTKAINPKADRPQRVGFIRFIYKVPLLLEGLANSFQLFWTKLMQISELAVN
jgi:hypothetical protein